ncbi:MAG TPA: hypothetical protein VMX14_13200 [Anaerolineae bacterium]|nr:hypothetical protein [Anaerolineae bacterium]
MTNNYNRLSDRERLEAGHSAPCAICGKVIQPARQTHTVVPGETILLVQKIARLPFDTMPTPHDAVICAFCQDPARRDPTNDFRRPDKASAYEHALKHARQLPDAVLTPPEPTQGETPDTTGIEHVQNKVQTTYPNMLALHAGQVAAKALRVERGRRRALAAIAIPHQQAADNDQDEEQHKDAA